MPIEVLVPDIERRKAHIDLVDPSHPLLRCALVCLNNLEKDIPTAQEVCFQMVSLKMNVQYTNSMQEYSERTLSSQLAAKELQLKTLFSQLEAKDQESASKEAVINTICYKLNEERKFTASELRVIRRQLSRKSQQMMDLQVLLEAMNKGIAEVTSELGKTKHYYVGQKTDIPSSISIYIVLSFLAFVTLCIHMYIHTSIFIEADSKFVTKAVSLFIVHLYC